MNDVDWKDQHRVPMVANRQNAMERVYGDTPAFLGCPVVSFDKVQKHYDVIIAGVPWEGTVTWGSFSGCELAPRSIRHAAARYGGFLPEFEINLFDYLTVADIGDVPVDPNNTERTMQLVYEAASKIYRLQSIPVLLGGDHSFTPEVIRALGDQTEGSIGLIHFDAHLDNAECFGNDLYPRCSPLYRAAQNNKVRNKSIVHFGIRGPRNSRAQLDFAKEIGATVFSMNKIAEMGFEFAIEESLRIARTGTDRIYVTICSDILDGTHNPGGPADFNGLTPSELFYAVHQIGKSGFSGLDYVEVYPIQDPYNRSSHLAAWTIIYALAGLAAGKKNRSD
jgi:agmatinase